MTLADQVRIYWHIQHCWHDAELAVKENATFGYAVKALRGIINFPGSANIKVLATALLDDIVTNTSSPIIPELKRATL